MDELRERKANDAVESAPPGTPAWALGLAFAATSFLSSFLGLYVAASPDLRAWIGSKVEIRKQELASAQEIGQQSNASILSIVATYSTQVADLSRLVGTLQQERNSLGAQVAALAREVDSIKGDYASCKAKLEGCNCKR